MAAELTNTQIMDVACERLTGFAWDEDKVEAFARAILALAIQGAEPVGFVHYRSTGLGSTVREAVLTPAGLELPDGALLYTAPPPKAKCTCVYATAKNTPAVRQGYEMGGYVKSSAGCPVHDIAPAPAAEVEKKAARYDWLRNATPEDWNRYGHYADAALDAILDAALQSDQAQAGKGDGSSLAKEAP